jgi:hypothetical protein
MSTTIDSTPPRNAPDAGDPRWLAAHIYPWMPRCVRLFVVAALCLAVVGLAGRFWHASPETLGRAVTDPIPLLQAHDRGQFLAAITDQAGPSWVEVAKAQKIYDQEPVNLDVLRNLLLTDSAFAVAHLLLFLACIVCLFGVAHSDLGYAYSVQEITPGEWLLHALCTIPVIAAMLHLTENGVAARLAEDAIRLIIADKSITDLVAIGRFKWAFLALSAAILGCVSWGAAAALGRRCKALPAACGEVRHAKTLLRASALVALVAAPGAIVAGYDRADHLMATLAAIVLSCQLAGAAAASLLLCDVAARHHAGRSAA